MKGASKESDDSLMARVAKGDSIAFEALLTRYDRRILNFANHIVRNRATAEDILQGTFLRLFENAKTYRPSGTFSTFLFRIARNLSLNELAKTKPTGTITSDPSSSRDDPGVLALASEEARHLRRALQGLADQDREIVWLRVYEKMSYREISDVTGLKENTARSRMRHALTHLSRRLEPGYTDE